MPMLPSVVPKPVVIEVIVSAGAEPGDGAGDQRGDQQRGEGVEAGAQHQHDDRRDADHEGEQQLDVHVFLLGVTVVTVTDLPARCKQLAAEVAHSAHIGERRNG